MLNGFFSLSNYDLLRDHYRSSHYLCEIGQCKDVQFTNVFLSEIDIRAHQAAQHSKNRAEARQLGTIPVEFHSVGMRDRRQQRDLAHRGDDPFYDYWFIYIVFIRNIQK